MKLDIVVCTKDSDRISNRIPVLDKCFESIKREIPYDNVILVDAFSTDKTVKKAEKYFEGRLKTISRKEKLGKARQIGFEHSKAEWIFVIDSDVVLPENAWNEIAPLTKKYDAVECDFTNFYPDGKVVDSGRRVRGILCATLVKREFLEGIEIPEDMEVYEDDFIKSYLISKGGTWFPCNVKVTHYPKEQTLQTAYKVGYFSAKYKLKPFLTVVGGLVKYHDSFYFAQFRGWIKSRLR